MDLRVILTIYETGVTVVIRAEPTPRYSGLMHDCSGLGALGSGHFFAYIVFLTRTTHVSFDLYSSVLAVANLKLPLRLT